MRLKYLMIYTTSLLCISSFLFLLLIQPFKAVYAESENHQEENYYIASEEEFLCWPVEGKLDPDFWYTTTVKNGDYYISSPFGYRIFFGNYWWHSGLDLATWGAHRDILAAESGKVIKVEERSTGYGNNIIIDHGDNLTTLYAHLEEIKVKQDQKVERGEVIGKAGETGDATGVHLHFEVRIDGRANDPLPFLGMESRPPVNNYFNESMPVNTGRNIAMRGTNSGAYKEEQEPLHAGEEGGRSVWFSWSPPENGIYFFKTSDTSFRSILGVYKGKTVCNLKELAESSDASAKPSGIFYGTPEEDYFIAIDGAGGSSGLFNLIWDEIPSGSIKGTVTDIETAKGINGVKVELESRDFDYKLETLTTNDGKYEFQAVPAGLNKLNFINNDKLVRTENDISVKENKSVVMNVETDYQETVPEIILGDVNLDKKIDVKDAIAILRYIVSLETLNKEQLINADVNLDGKVNVLDATLILRYVVGMVESFPAE